MTSIFKKVSPGDLIESNLFNQITDKIEEIDDKTSVMGIEKISNADESELDNLSIKSNVSIGTTDSKAQLHLPGGNWDLSKSEGDLKIGNKDYRLKIGVAKSGEKAGDVRICADGGTNRLMLGGVKDDTLTIVNGNVGIGTTYPKTQLHLSGGNGDLSKSEGDLKIGDTDCGLKIGVTKSGEKTGDVRIYADGGTNRLMLGGGKEDTLTIVNGNIGIGISTPSAELEVNGDIKAKAIEAKPALRDFKVEGKLEEFYPIFFKDDNWAEGPLILEINRPNIDTDSSGRGSLISKFTVHSGELKHGCDICRAEIYSTDTQFVAGYQNNTRSDRFVVWLRGGGTTYYFRSNHFVTLEDFSATEKKYKINEKEEIVFNVKTSVDSNVLSNAIHFDKSLIIDGKVGVGTTAPSAKLEVNGDIKAEAIESKPKLHDFKVEGDSDKFYPILFKDDNWKDGPLILEINRTQSGIDKQVKGSLISKFTVHSSRWGNGCNICRAEIYDNGTQFIAGYQNDPLSDRFVVWLRGGGATYSFRSSHFATLEDSSATGKQYKVLDKEVLFSIKTGVDSNVLSNAVHLDNSLIIDGNVGIGTTTPSAKLDVNGTVKAAKFVGDGSGLTGIKIGQWTDITGGISYNSGNVGIGTNDIKRRLHVEGNNSEIHSGGSGAGFSFANRSANSFVDSPSKGERWIWYSYGDPGIAYLWSGKNLLSIDKDGNVGIGTDKPENAEGWTKVLDISGSVSSKLSVRTQNVDARVFSHENSFWGAPAGMFVGTKSAHPLSFGTNSSSKMTINKDGNVGIGTDKPSEKLEVNGTVKAAKFVGDGSGLTGIASTSKTQWTDVAGGGISYNSGNIGIGTDKPENAEGWEKVLDIFSSLTTKLSIRTPNIDARVLSHEYGTWGAPTGMIIGTKSAHPLSFGTSATSRMTINKDGKIGIGTNNPQRSLHVLSNDGQNLVLQSTKGGPGSTVSLDFQTYATVNNQLSPTASVRTIDDGNTSSHLTISTKEPGQEQNGLKERLRITSDGKVGIGTSIPGTALDVIKADGVAIRALSNSENSHTAYQLGRTGAESSWGVAGKAGQWAPDAVAGDVILRTEKGQKLLFTTNANRQSDLVISNGNVGIGTTAPSEKLEVNGNIKLSGHIAQDDWIPASLSNGWVNYGDGYNPAGYFLDKNGVVHLRGLVKSGKSSIFTLPSGYRPQYRELFTVTAADALSRCDISTTGEVTPMSGGNSYYSLDGITFRAKQ